MDSRLMNSLIRKFVITLMVLAIIGLGLPEGVQAQENIPEAEMHRIEPSDISDGDEVNDFQLYLPSVATDKTSGGENKDVDDGGGENVNPPGEPFTGLPMPMRDWAPPLNSEDGSLEFSGDGAEPSENEETTDPIMGGSEPPSIVPPVSEPDVSAAVFGGYSGVTDVESYPWRSIVRIHVYHDELSNSYYVCSGALIRERHVITSGGCVYDDAYGTPTSIVVVPAYDDGTYTYGQATAQPADLRTFFQWRNNQDFDYGIGLITLDRPVGALTGYLGYGWRSNNNFFSSTTFRNPGYHFVSPYDGDRMSVRSGTFDTVETHTLRHSGPANSNPGSVVFPGAGDGANNVMGVSSFVQGSDAGYTRITSDKFDQITSWIDADTPSSPDLVPLWTRATPTRIVAGNDLTDFRFLLHNDSSSTWDGTLTVNVYLSTNDTISTSSDEWLASYSYGIELGPKGGSNLFTTTPPWIPTNTPGGTYYLGVQVVATDSNTGNNITQDWDVARIQIDPVPPEIEVYRSSLDFDMNLGGYTPADQDIYVGGVGSFSWSARSDEDWLVLDRTFGYRGDSIGVSIDPDGLSPQAYNANITITSPMASGQPIVIPVRFDLTLPELNVSISTPELTVDYGGPPTSTTLTVSIDGYGLFPWTTQSGAEWLTMDPEDGVNGGAVTVYADPEGLRPGRYFVELEIDAGEVLNSPWTVPISLTVDAGPAGLVVEPPWLHFNAAMGGPNPSPQSIAINSANGLAFPWRAETDAPWLPGRTGGGTTPGTFDVAPDITGLAVGEYTTNVILTSPSDSRPDGTRTVSVTLRINESVPGAPIMQVSPATLRFEGVIGGANPEAQQFLIDNAGDGELSWTAEANVPWLQLDPASGSGPAMPIVTIDSVGMGATSHFGQITVSDDTGSAQRVNVILSLNRPPTLAVDNTNLVYTALTGEGDPPPKAFTVRNAGSGVFDWSASEDIPWLTLDATSGQTPAMVNATASTAGLELGLYDGVISVSGDGAVGSPKMVDASLYLRRGPALDLYPEVLYLDVIGGENVAAAGQIDVLNVGLGRLNWMIEEEIPWLSVDKTQGQIGALGRAVVNVGVDARELAPSDTPYTGQITVRSNNGEGSPQTIHVSLIVASPARYCRIPAGGSDHVMYANILKLKLENVQRQITLDGGCDLSAQLRIDMPQNEDLVTGITGHVTPENKFTSTPENRQANLYAAVNADLHLQVSGGELILSGNYSIDDEIGIEAPSARFKLPSPLVPAEQINSKLPVQLTEDPELVTLDANVLITPAGIRLGDKATLELALPGVCYQIVCLYENTLEAIVAPDYTFVLQITSKRGIVQLPEGNDPGELENIELSFESKQERAKGTIGRMVAPSLAGLRLEAHNVELRATNKGQELYLASAHLIAPEEWIGKQDGVSGASGDGRVSIYGIRVDIDKIVKAGGEPSEGDITIDSGEFVLPELVAGGFRLYSLRGRLLPLENGKGYQLDAHGRFAMITAYRECPISVDVLITAKGVQVQSVPVQPAADDPDIHLNNLSIRAAGCDPGIPLDNGMFFVTDLNGNIVLTPDTNQIDFSAYIQTSRHKVRVPVLGWQPWVAADPSLRVRLTSDREDFEQINFQSRVILAGFSILKAKAEVDQEKARIDFIGNETLIAYGITVTTHGYRGSNPMLDVIGWSEVVINKGLISKDCFNVPSPTLSNPGRVRQVCNHIPSYDVRLARNEAGGGIDSRGFYISSSEEKWGFRFGWKFYVLSGQLDVDVGGPFAAAVSSAEVQSVRATGVQAAADSQIHFGPEGEVLIDMPVSPALPEIQASDVISEYVNEMRRDIAFTLLQPITGSLDLSVIDPDGQNYTPENLPDNMHFIETATMTETYSMMTIGHAMPGTWKVRVAGDTDSTEYVIFYQSTTPPPSFGERTHIRDLGNNQAYVQWRVFSPSGDTPINIYASDEPETVSIPVSDSDDEPETETVQNLSGIRIAEIMTSTVNGTVQSYVPSTIQLPSGEYWFWIEAETPGYPLARQILRDNQGNPVKISIDNSAAFPASWSPNATTELDIKEGEMAIEWRGRRHPDLSHYVVRVETSDPLSPTLQLVQDVVVGPGLTDGKARTVLTNIGPGQTYQITLGLVGPNSQQPVWAQPLNITTPQPDFIVRTDAQNIEVEADGEATTVPVLVELDSDLPHPVSVRVDAERLPVGITVELVEQVVSTAATQGTLTAQISASANLPSGRYVVPLVAQSGPHSHTLDIKVKVTSTNPMSSDEKTFLPVLLRK